MIDVDEVPSAPPSRRRRRIWMVLVSLLAVMALGVGGLGVYAMRASQGSEGGEAVQVVIDKGMAASAIADRLAEQEVIRDAWLFRFVARLRGVAADLRAGKYEMRTGMSYAEVISTLRKGPAVKFTRVTIPEGRTIRQAAAIIGENTHISAADFLRAVRSGAHAPAILPEGVDNLEGFLFPKTYDILEDATADDVVERLIHQFERETASLDVAARARALGVTPYQAIVVASLVEREAKVDAERPIVASVIYNRIKRGMRLEIDATVQYAMYLRDGRFPTRILYRDLEIDSPYNTYRIDGLPPAPIASPGLASIEAALRPADTDYLFYVLKNERGEHAFARTLAEHNRNVARYR